MARKSANAEPELKPDAWERFERFVRDIAKAGPQHRTKPKVGRKAAARKKAT
jgi:hypothetical protein